MLTLSFATGTVPNVHISNNLQRGDPYYLHRRIGVEPVEIWRKKQSTPSIGTNQPTLSPVSFDLTAPTGSAAPSLLGLIAHSLQ